MNELLLHVHSIVRWIVSVGLVVVVIRYAAVWRGGAASGRADRVLLAMANGAIDLQVLIGLVLFVSTGIAAGGVPRAHVEHGATMIVAAIAAHLGTKLRAPDARIRARNICIGSLVAAVVIAIGVARLPGGWHF